MQARTIASMLVVAGSLTALDTSTIATGSVQRSALIQRLRPHSESPIASDGMLVYAVGADRQTILASNLSKGGSDWEHIARLDGAEIRGLAWYRGRLFASDAIGAAIYAVTTGGKGGQVMPIHKGPPLKEPTEMTFMNDLIVVDAEAETLFRIAVGPGEPVLHQVRSEIEVHEDTFIAAWGSELLMSDSDTGRIALVTDLRSTRGPKVWGMQQRVEANEPYVERSNDAKSRVPSLTRATSPSVDSPGSMTAFNGIVYVIDSKTRQIFAAATSDARTVRLQLPALGDIEPSRLIATSAELIVFDGRSGRLHRWPRPVPTEIRFVNIPTAETLATVHDYLHRRGMLPLRREPYPSKLDETLQSERVSRGVFCSLNPDRCAPGAAEPADTSGTTIALPDLYVERAITVARVQLDGTKSLGEIVDDGVADPRFKSMRGEDHLREINGYKAGDTSIREMRTGAFRVPREQVRYLAAFDTRDLKGDNPDFQQLADSVRDIMRFVPLERVLSSAASVPSIASALQPIDPSDEQHPNDPNCVKARDAFERLLTTISHAIPPSMVRVVSVGIAERKFDDAHLDFMDTNGPVFKPRPSDDPCTPATDDPATEPPVPATTEPVIWRKLGRCDHGTAVASLLGARSRPFAAAPLLPNVQLVPIHWEDPRLSQDIDRTMADSHTTVFNLSLKLHGESDGLLQAIETYSELATFVVAAGNDARQLCKPPGGRVYPACWGDHNNLIVVGGTSLDGQSIQSRSNTGSFVHIVAPAADYYAAGADNAYGPVEGTSFAAALVSATAAMLSGMGIDRPVLIKQRIISTAEIDSHLPDWARRLNVQRAISHVHHAVLTRKGQPTKVVALERLGQDIAFMLDRGGAKLPLTVGQIRRLVRDSRDRTKFLLAYADNEDERLRIVRVRVPQLDWKFSFRTLDANGQPTGAEQTGDFNEYDDYVGPIGK